MLGLTEHVPILRKSTTPSNRVDPPDTWKDRFHNCLDELERKEARWREVEAELQRYLARLALALYGCGNPELDVLLERIRSLARDGDSGADMDRAIEALHAYRDSREVAAGKPAASADSGAALHRLVDTLSAHVPELRTSTPGADAGAALESRIARVLLARLTPDASPLPAQTLLRELVDRLDVPTDLDEQLDAARDALSKPIDNGSLRAVVASISNVVGKLRRQLQAQRVEIEGFLLGLHRRLGDMGATLKQAQRARLQSHDRAGTLARGINSEMSALRGDIDRASDLDGLKSVIAQRLENISTCLEQHVEAEARTNQQFETQISRLRDTVLAAESDAEQLRATLESVRNAAQRDTLTGLFNRAAFDKRLAEEHARTRGAGARYTLLLWDIDLFKDINDTYGHQAGDKVLKAVAQLLVKHVGGDDFVARYGGEEMVCLMPGAGHEAGYEVAETVRRALGQAGFRYGDASVHVTLSCGLTESNGDAGWDSVFKRANEALYEAKANGRNRIVIK